MFIIYGKSNCIFCDRAKALLEMRGLEYSYRDINVGSHYEDMKHYFPDAKTVPQIVVDYVIDFDMIGGYTQLQEYLSK